MNHVHRTHHHCHETTTASSSYSTIMRKAFEGATTLDAENFRRAKDEDISSSIRLYFVPSKWMSKLLEFINLQHHGDSDSDADADADAHGDGGDGDGDTGANAIPNDHDHALVGVSVGGNANANGNAPAVPVEVVASSPSSSSPGAKTAAGAAGEVGAAAIATADAVADAANTALSAAHDHGTQSHSQSPPPSSPEPQSSPPPSPPGPIENEHYLLLHSSSPRYMAMHGTYMFGNETGNEHDHASSPPSPPIPLHQGSPLSNRSSSNSSRDSSSDHSEESARAKRAARREKWKQKEQHLNQQDRSNSSSNATATTVTTSSSSSSHKNKDKRLRSGLKYGRDYILVGEGLWTLLSNKFGFDVMIDLEVKVVDDPDYESGGGRGRGRGGHGSGSGSATRNLPPTRRVIQVYPPNHSGMGIGLSSWVDLPSDGVFDYPALVKDADVDTSANADGYVMMDHRRRHVELVSDEKGSDTCSDDDADAVASSTKDDEELFPLEDSADEDDASNSPILLLPPSTTSTNATNACRSLYLPSSSDMVLDSDPAKSSDDDDDDSEKIIKTHNDASSSPSSSTSAGTGNAHSNPSNTRKRKRYGSGLGNLGNTCFMNSTLQCLAHTGPLRSYFLSGEYASDLNRDNPLGTGGELATEFANLLSEMWGTGSGSGTGAGTSSALRNSSMTTTYGYRRSWNTPHSNSSSVVYPRNFKYTLGKHAEQFMGYNQHDSQELATYLLDALHEDTNRVSKKPYVEKPEQGEDECDEEAANKAWALHLKREDSRVLESFMGQVKSRVECPREHCGRVSTTFDPFMYLSIPLPGATERTIEVTFVPIASDMCRRKFHVTVSKNALMKDLQKKTASLIQESEAYSFEDMDVDAKDLVIGEVFQQDIYMFYSGTDEVSRIRESDDIYAFQVASVESIHDKQDKAKEEEDRAQSPLEEQPERSSAQKLKLDLATITKLNRDWEEVFMTYLTQSHMLPALMNSRRHHTHEDRMNFHQKVNNFINRCYASPECTTRLTTSSSVSSQSDLELESFDGSESESDGKSSPTTHVANRLGAAVVDDNAQSLEELCQTFSSFKGVRTPNDVATLEFCNNKLYQYSMNKVKEKKLKYRDGAEIQVTFRMPTAIGSTDRKCGLPVILRISPTLTVYGLRKMLASRLAPCLNMASTDAKVQQQSSGDSSKETKDEPMTHEDPHRNHDFLLNDDCGEELRILRQVSLTYERKNSPNSYAMKPSSYRKLGSILNSDKSSFSHRSPVSFAMPDDEAESETVLEIVGRNGKVFVHWPSNDLFDEDKWTYHECEGTHHKEGEKEQDITVLDCIRKYCQIEQLEESEMWYCNKCKEHVQAWKQFHLYRTPPILIVHLKRFHYSSLTHRRDKIDLFVDFPLKGLDLTKEVMYWDEGEEPIYDCYAVSNHFGGLGGGHYTAYAVNDEGEWCNFDDSRVSTNVDEADVVSSAAYVLYYRRRDVKVDDQVWADRPLPSLSTRDSNPSKQMDIEGSSTDGLLTSSTPTCPSPMGSIDDMCDEEMVDTVFDPVDI